MSEIRLKSSDSTVRSPLGVQPGNPLPENGISRTDKGAATLERQARRKEPLGFGVGDLLPLLTPVLWIALTKAIETVVEDGTKSLWRRAVRKIRPKSAEVVPPLTSAQIEEACRMVRAELVEKGFDEDGADATVEALRRHLEKRQAPGRGAVEA